MTRRVSILAVVMVLVNACGSGSGGTLPDIDALRCASGPGPAAQPSSLPGLAQLGASERSPQRGVIVHSGHGTVGAEPPVGVRGATRRELGRELRAAAFAACQLRTTVAAERAGYVLSSNYTQGVGTHWTNWRLVDAPFDPARPAMLLYAPRLGTTQLVGFSYWNRTSDPAGPAGYAGTADHWHRHYGLCFDRAGLLQRENVRTASLCAGVYVNGSDIWMLHAWIVPGAANAWGTFAPLNPQLCSRSVADIARCPGMGGP
jgi:hypothetical protein